MKILISGGTGFVGKHLLPQLQADGHPLMLLTRNPERAKKAFPFPVETVPWHSGGGVPSLPEGIDAVIHLAGEGIADKRWTEARKKELYDSRVTGTREIVAAIQKLAKPPECFISSSAIGFYGDRGDNELDESSPLGTGFLAEICRDWEAEVQKLSSNTRTVLVRTGMVLSPDGGALGKLLPVFRLGLGGPVGGGKQWVSWIHIDDLIALFRFALNDKRVQGAVNATAPHPVTNADLAHALGAVLHKPAVVPTPAIALKLAMGEMAQELILSSQRVFPRRAMEWGFSYKHPELLPALQSMEF